MSCINRAPIQYISIPLITEADIILPDGDTGERDADSEHVCSRVIASFKSHHQSSTHTSPLHASLSDEGISSSRRNSDLASSANGLAFDRGPSS